MKRDKFEKIDPLLDRLAESIDGLLAQEPWTAVKQHLAEISEILGEKYSLTLELNLQVFDPTREHSLPLLQTGFATSNGEQPHPCWGDSTPQRYVVNGQLVVVPHDRCPACWGIWDVKDQHPDCDHCGVSMGRDVKFSLDNDQCPHCEMSTVSASNPTCGRCGESVNPAFIYWG
jgi:ribosomal protein S27AE